MQPSGPRTEEGKMRSRYNALKHGLTGQTVLIHDDQRQHYEAHCQSYVDLYSPVGRPEEVLVKMIADDYWRSLTGRALESRHMVGANGREPGTVQNLSNLSLYLNRIERSIKTNTKALEEMQAQRKEARRQAEEEVKLLARAAFAKGETYNPANDFPPERGFVFSEPQIAAIMAREDRLKAAAQWQDQRFNPADKPEKPAYQVLKAA